MGPSLSPLKGGEGKKGRCFDSLSAPGGGEGRGEVGESRAIADTGFVTRQKERPPEAARLKEKEAAKGGLEAEGRMPMRAARSAKERVGQRMPDKHR